MIHYFVATSTAPDLSRRTLAHSTVETDRGPAAALKLAIADLEERGELRGQSGLDVTEIAARTWKNVYFIGADRRLVEVTGLQNGDTLDFALAHARHSARADEHEIEVLYTDDTRERFAVRPEDRSRAANPQLR